MKKLMITIFLLCSLVGCKTHYVPVETTRIEKEYVDSWQRDSVYQHDSVWIEKKGDTLWLEKYKTYYKEVIKRDSLFITDSIRIEIPYPVVEIKEVNRLRNWQILLMCLGSVFIAFIGYRLLKWWKK